MHSSPRAEAEVDPPAEARRPTPARSSHILGMRVDCTSYARATDAIVELARKGAGGHVCIATVHMVMEAFDDPSFRAAVNAAELVTPDGVPLVWTLRRRGFEAERVYGPTLTPIVCERASREGIPVGFYGGTPEVLGSMRGELERRFPDLDVAFAQSPPFRGLSDEEDAQVVSAILDSGAGILFVGLGCPKQERWMAAHRAALDCVQVGVGAAFDFIAGAKLQAPAWIQRAGMEWAFRLLTEPRRLWRRYLHNNPRFIVQLMREERLASAGRIDVERKRG